MKIDITKLKSISTYAKSKGKSPQRIYQLAEEGKVELIEIDGVKFIFVE